MSYRNSSSAESGSARGREWFDKPDPTGRTETGERGLRFRCTSCGNCCSGAPGYVGFTDEEAGKIAGRLGISVTRFLDEYVHGTPLGRSIRDVPSKGYDCVFLDRDSVPGKALCKIYEDRPEQCRTWPFWGSVVKSRDAWTRASFGCPGIDHGPLYPPQHVRLTRDRVEI